MSHQATNWVTEHVTVGSAFGKSILTHLANCADEIGIAYPSIDYLVRVTELSRATVFRWLRVLETGGALARINTTNRNGKPVHGYQLAIEKVIDLSAGQSQTETDESQSETQKPHGEGDGVSVCDSPSLSTETPYNPSLIQDPSPKPPPAAEAQQGKQEEKQLSPSQALKEPIGFNALCNSGPDPELVRRPKALEEFVALGEGDRRKAIERWVPYNTKCLAAKKKPVALHLWLRERGFDQVGTGALAASAGRQVTLPDAGEQASAWRNFFAIGNSGRPHIPHTRARIAGHIQVPGEWPPGGARWLVPPEEWCFVEEGTPQYWRYVGMVRDVLGAAVSIPLVRGDNHRHLRLITRDGAGWGDRQFHGLVVPREWPPAKGEGRPPMAQPNITGPPISQEDIEEFTSNSS